jgi:hypothetical protein
VFRQSQESALCVSSQTFDCGSLLPLWVEQPAVDRTALAWSGAITSYPPPWTAGCHTQSGSRLPQSPVPMALMRLHDFEELVAENEPAEMSI